MTVEYRRHSTHWGLFEGRAEGDRLDVRPPSSDQAPSPLLGNLPESLRHSTRVAQPMVRRSWLENGPGPGPRTGPFVPVDWDQAAELVAGELTRVKAEHGNQSIYAGSYGWSSAGRFHHAQSHVHRFLNVFGGYVSSRASYSLGTAEVFLPHVLGPAADVARLWHEWESIIDGADLILAFGGMPSKNVGVASGGIAEHRVGGYLDAYAEGGGQVVSLSPLRDDFPELGGVEWQQMRPFGDVPLLLAMCHVLLTEDRYDRSFLDRYTVGFDRVADYLRGCPDGQPKDPDWAAALCGIPADRIVELARRAARSRTLVNVTYSLQRAERGEQPMWAALTFAAMLGQIGLPGRGFAFSLGSMGNSGSPPMGFAVPALPQGANPVQDFIPVARIADALLHPGEKYEYDGGRLVYPDLRLVYWVGGNPFHHHQDLFRLREAFERPETVIVHEQFWTATARRADIVLPATLSVERRDIGAGRQDRRLVAMEKLAEPFAQALDDYEIFTRIARRLGLESEYTEGRDAEQWLEHLFERLQESMRAAGIEPPSYRQFWSDGSLTIPPAQREGTPVELFRRDPAAHPLSTPSGRIELFSETIDGFGYDDCPGHVTWLDPGERVDDERRAEGWLQLVANNPATRLHSQLDIGRTSQDSKIGGREPLRMHPADAAERGLKAGQVVLVENDRGACLAGLALSDDVLPGVVQLSTGAWFEPVTIDGREVCAHGNPNAVTRDIGTSRLSQGCSGQLAAVRVSRFDGTPPPVTVTSTAP